MKLETFEEFLMDKYADQHIGTKETLVDGFNDWLGELEVDDIIEYADEFNKEMLKKQKEKIREKVKYIIRTAEGENMMIPPKLLRQFLEELN